MDTRSSYHSTPAPPPPSSVDQRLHTTALHPHNYPYAAPPPPPPQQQQQQQHHYPYQHPPQPPPQSLSTLPPIGHGSNDSKLPALGAPPPPPPPHPPHDPREGTEYHHHHHQQQPPPPPPPPAPSSHQQPPQQHYSDPNRSGHVTPAPVNRSYSVDSSHQRTPTTPSQPGAYPPVSADGQHPPHPMEHTTHHGYPPSSGVPPGMGPPPMQGPPAHHDHPQQYMTPVMENHHSYAPPHLYPQSSYGPASAAVLGTGKRKHMRATQACEQCRQRKQKCDEGSPCSFCKENSLSCQYRDTPPAKTDKYMEKMLNFIDNQQAAMEKLQSAMLEMSSRMKRMEDQTPSRMSVSHRDVPPSVMPPPVSQIDEASQSGSESPQKRSPALGDHRTAPHKLLMLWPSVQELLHAANDNSSESYVMTAEDRGVLRLYTRGESSLDDIEGTLPLGPASPAISEESGEGAPTPPDGLWGTGLAQTPGSNVSRRSDRQLVGGLKANGSLDLEPHTVLTLVEQYIRNFHIMHPFLDKQKLRRMADTFVKRYSSAQPAKNRAPFAVPNNDYERPMKRQRSNGSSAPENPATYLSHTHHSLPERSPSNAIIYLVLALGKMCTYKDPLPGPVSEHSSGVNTLTNSQMVVESPMSNVTFKTSPHSPSVTPMTHSTPLHLDHLQSRSRRSSVDGPGTGGFRNLDVIPGLAYFAKAVEVLGDQADGQDLVHAQLFLLAGLYKGQLARVKESLSWYTMAGRVLQMLLDKEKLFNHNYWTNEGSISTRLERGQAIIKNMRINLIVVASWSCLQLESDILAELQLPASNLPDYEDRLLFPRRMPEDESYGGLNPIVQADGSNLPSDDVTNLFYVGQLYIRRRLNKVHRELYGSQCYNMTLAEVRHTLISHEQYLQEWRAAVPPNTKWEDDDPPPADILSARLRAKYWGARYVINRPFLDYFLHIMPHVREGKEVEASARDNNGQSRHAEEIHLFKAIALMPESDIMSACVRCVQAAMYSTVAFDGVPDRLIVTNIHGTAHAQFGNMLVLSATYFRLQKMPRAPDLVPKRRLGELLERTIRFLRKLRAISPTCRADCQILEKIYNTIFPNHGEPIYQNQGVEAGFSSMHSSFSYST